MNKEIPRKSYNVTDDLAGMIECPICMEVLSEPKVLRCQHSFCADCLTQLPVEQNNGRSWITCPTCRKKELLQDGTIHSLQHDHKSIQMIDLYNKTASSTNETFEPVGQPSLEHKWTSAPKEEATGHREPRHIPNNAGAGTTRPTTSDNCEDADIPEWLKIAGGAVVGGALALGTAWLFSDRKNRRK